MLKPPINLDSMGRKAFETSVERSEIQLDNFRVIHSCQILNPESPDN